LHKAGTTNKNQDNKAKKGRQKEHFFVCAINISESSKKNTSGGKLLGGKFHRNLEINFLMLNIDIRPTVPFSTKKYVLI